VVRDAEMFLIGAHISPLQSASTHINPDPVRTRKLLLKADEIKS
jgi:SsrA-binding protein